jgi:hypothetical protein
LRTIYPSLTISDGFNVVFKGLGSLNCKKTVSAFRVTKGASVLMGRSLPETQYQRRCCTAKPHMYSKPGVENISIHQ